MNKLDISGRKFGRLLAISESGRRKNGAIIWECLCDCGNITHVTASALVCGAIVSCGCSHSKYGYKSIGHDRLYSIWKGMRRRCYSPNASEYQYYGGRGITVCDEWNSDFLCFRDWALSNGYQKDLTIDRIDNNGNYCPDNCRWVSSVVQNNNFSRNRRINFDGVSLTVSEWARKIGITQQALQKRLNNWPIDRALTEPRNEWCVR